MEGRSSAIKQKWSLCCEHVANRARLHAAELTCFQRGPDGPLCLTRRAVVVPISFLLTRGTHTYPELWPGDFRENRDFSGIRRENKRSLLLTPSGLPPPTREVIISEGLTPLLYLYIPRPGWGVTGILYTPRRTFALGVGQAGGSPLGFDSSWLAERKWL